MQFLYKLKFIPFALLIFLISFACIPTTLAQTEIFAFGGYIVSSKIKAEKGEFSIEANPDYGLGIDIELRRGMQLEIIWISTQTHVTIAEPRLDEPTDLWDLNIHYFQIGAVLEMGRRKTRPFFAFTVGAALFDAKDPDVNDEWLASFTMGFGGKYDFSDNIGIRLQARLLVPLVFSGGGLWVGTGGVGVGVSSWAPVIQFDLTAGIYIRIGGRGRPKSIKDIQN